MTSSSSDLSDDEINYDNSKGCVAAKPMLEAVKGIKSAAVSATALDVIESVSRAKAMARGPSAQELMRRERTTSTSSAVWVAVQRSDEIIASRLLLPIMQEEHSIVEMVDDNLITIICGETGSGKTTQVPQFLFEAGYTRGSSGSRRGRDGMMIGVTEPRRIAAVRMALRVAHELGLSEREVSHQVRYDVSASDTTEIKFMTDGILAKEIETDFALKKYSAIVIDEAHERSMHTDILLGTSSL